MFISQTGRPRAGPAHVRGAWGIFFYVSRLQKDDWTRVRTSDELVSTGAIRPPSTPSHTYKYVHLLILFTSVTFAKAPVLGSFGDWFFPVCDLVYGWLFCYFLSRFFFKADELLGKLMNLFSNLDKLFSVWWTFFRFDERFLKPPNFFKLDKLFLSNTMNFF